MNKRTVFITGASKGFGRVWTEALLKKGYNVAATSRNVDSLGDLASKYGDAILPLQLDLTQRDNCLDAVEKAWIHFGSIDVLINNAGYALFGPVEEATEDQARDQFDVNFFAALWLTQAVLPYMRKQQHGHIIQVSSILGLASLPLMGMYGATKFAIEGLSESLRTEVAGFGVNVTLVEPNGYHSDIWTTGINTTSTPEYGGVRKAVSENSSSDSFGRVESTANAIIQLIESANPPLRLLLGKVAMPFVRQAYDSKMKVWEEWSEVSASAQ